MPRLSADRGSRNRHYCILHTNIFPNITNRRNRQHYELIYPLHLINYFPFVNTGKYNHITDQELLEKFYADHNNEWLGVLLERYTLLLLGVCMKYLKNEDNAKDSVQQIFLKVLTEVSKHQITYFKSWLYMVAKNYCLM